MRPFKLNNCPPCLRGEDGTRSRIAADHLPEIADIWTQRRGRSLAGNSFLISHLQELTRDQLQIDISVISFTVIDFSPLFRHKVEQSETFAWEGKKVHFLPHAKINGLAERQLWRGMDNLTLVETAKTHWRHIHESLSLSSSMVGVWHSG